MKIRVYKGEMENCYGTDTATVYDDIQNPKFATVDEVIAELKAQLSFVDAEDERVGYPGYYVDGDESVGAHFEYKGYHDIDIPVTVVQRIKESAIKEYLERQQSDTAPNQSLVDYRLLARISADGGETWTEQWLTQAEIAEHREYGYIVDEVRKKTPAIDEGSVTKVLLYYGWEETADGVFHALELTSYPNFADGDEMAAKLAEALECDPDSDNFDFDCMSLALPAETINRIKAVGVEEYLNGQQHSANLQKAIEVLTIERASHNAGSLVEQAIDVALAEMRKAQAGCEIGGAGNEV